MDKFKLVSDYKPSGDQPEAIQALAEALHAFDHGNDKLEKALELAKQA